MITKVKLIKNFSPTMFVCMCGMGRERKEEGGTSVQVFACDTGGEKRVTDKWLHSRSTLLWLELGMTGQEAVRS